MLSIDFLRQFRLGEYAIFDLAIAFLGILLLSPLLSRLFLKIRVQIPMHSWLLLTLPIGILAHLLVGRITPMTGYFLDLHSHYLLKILLLGLLILGLKDVRILKKT